MARIRTIKPEFWCSEQVAECSPTARLLFIGLWTFSDDGGVHPASLPRIKMEVFPGDLLTHEQIADLIEELKNNLLLVEYEVHGKIYWQVTGWQHQKIDKPTYKYPRPDGAVPSTPRSAVANTSTNDLRVISEPSPPECNGEEKEKSKSKSESPKGDLSPATVVAVNDHARKRDPIGNCPHEDIIDAYHELLPELRRVRDWTPERSRLLRSRWREDATRQNLEWWRRLFEYVQRSDFLMGRVPARSGETFEADLEWIIRPRNLVKIIEGKYESRAVA